MTTETTQARVSGTLDPIVRQFRLHWRSGKPQDITTRHPGSRMEAAAAAMNEAGIGAGALAALDYWEELPNASVRGGGTPYPARSVGRGGSDATV